MIKKEGSETFSRGSCNCDSRSFCQKALETLESISEYLKDKLNMTSESSPQANALIELKFGLTITLPLLREKGRKISTLGIVLNSILIDCTFRNYFFTLT